MKSDFAMRIKRYLPGIVIGLLVFVVLISPRVYAGADSNADGTCNTNGSSTSVAPSPYSNGAPISKVFYPADGSTVTVTTTGAVIKQSPCQTPYREGWVDPSGLCNLNSFSQLSGMVKSGDNNPYANNSNSGSSSCNSTQPSVVNNVSNSSTSVATVPANTTYPNNSYCNANTTNCCNVSNTNNTYNNSNCCNGSSVNNNNGNCCNNSTNGCCNANTTNCCNNTSVNCCNNGVNGCCNSSSTNCCNNNANNCCANNYSSTNCNSSAVSNNTTYTKTLPNTGPSDVLAVGGLSTVFGTVGHFIYRRRVNN